MSKSKQIRSWKQLLVDKLTVNRSIVEYSTRNRFASIQLKPIIRHGWIHQPATLQLCGTVMFCTIAVKIHLCLVSFLLRKKIEFFPKINVLHFFYVTKSQNSSFFVNSLLKKQKLFYYYLENQSRFLKNSNGFKFS